MHADVRPVEPVRVVRWEPRAPQVIRGVVPVPDVRDGEEVAHLPAVIDTLLEHEPNPAKCSLRIEQLDPIAGRSLVRRDLQQVGPDLGVGVVGAFLGCDGSRMWWPIGRCVLLVGLILDGWSRAGVIRRSARCHHHSHHGADQRRSRASYPRPSLDTSGQSETVGGPAQFPDDNYGPAGALTAASPSAAATRRVRPLYSRRNGRVAAVR